MNSKPAMGSLQWGRSSQGRLNAIQTARLVANMAMLQVREMLDTARYGLRLGKPRAIGLQTLAPPDNLLVSDCLALAVATHDPRLLAHSWRTYYLGRLLGVQEGITHDASLLFASAILHDLGLTDGHVPSLSQACFACSGGQRVHQYLCDKGHAQTISQQVGDAIALHLNAWVSKRHHGAHAHLLARGAVCDLFGFSRRRIAKSDLSSLLHQFPREGVMQVLQFETAHHLPGTRAYVMTRLSGGRAPADPYAEMHAMNDVPQKE